MVQYIFYIFGWSKPPEELLTFGRRSDTMMVIFIVALDHLGHHYSELDIISEFHLRRPGGGRLEFIDTGSILNYHQVISKFEIFR